jgi:hypothetical protein
MSSSYSNSSGQGTSQSTSTPVVAPINVDIAGLLTSLSGAAQGLANDTYQWATQQFNKSSVVTDQMVNDANTYSSQPRIQMAMGQAETDTGQAMDAGRVQAEQQLQSYGIDPSSGRYAALETAQAAQKAAAQAGAGQTAEQRTEDTGRQLRAQAINAELAAQNTGAAMKGVANQFLGTAAQALKYAPTGQNTQSTSQNTQASNSLSKSAQPQQQQRSGSGSGPGGGGSGSGPGGTWNDPGNIPNTSGSGTSTFSPNPEVLQTGASGSTMGTDIYNGGVTDPMANIYGGYNTGGDTNPGATNTGGIYDPNASYNSYDQGSGFSGPATGDTSSGYDTSNTNWGDFPTSGGGGDTSGGGGSYAAGGAVDDQTTGGQVPQSASPSQGIQTDDVPANLNEGEFVVPRDVAHWKGEEFFQKLIAQSRKARVTAPAAGKPGPALQGAPRFASQAMGA